MEWGRIGFLGLGRMGGPMAANLVHAGYEVTGYDLSAEAVEAHVRNGGRAAATAVEAVVGQALVLTSLSNSRTWVQVAEEVLVPHAVAGQVFVDLGTVAPPDCRRLAELLAERGAELLDVPVSGGPAGARQRNLRMFGGGVEATFERLRPLLEILGDPERIVYCGSVGAGQVVKGANQLALGLGAAVHAEALALVQRAGASLEAARQGVGGDEGWRREFARVAEMALEGRGDSLQVKFHELKYYLSEADAVGFELPLTRALVAFLEGGEERTLDELGQPAPSFWFELLRAGEPR